MRVFARSSMKKKKETKYREQDAVDDFKMVYLGLLVALTSFMIPFFSDYRVPVTKLSFAQYLIPIAILTDFSIRFGLKNSKKDGGMKDTSRSNFKHPILFYLYIISSCLLVGYSAMFFSSAMLING